MTKIILFYPILELPFKEPLGKVVKSSISPLRIYWKEFIELFDEFFNYDTSFDYSRVILPNWEITPELVDSYKADIVILPHREKNTLRIKSKALFFMQTVIPNYFTISPNGWGGNYHAKFEIDAADNFIDHILWRKLQKRISNNESKFEQPEKQIDRAGYELFVCQIPHDQTILLHSKYSVEECLEACIERSNKFKSKLVVKGHPINPGSMRALIEITRKGKYSVYVDNVNIHSALRNSTSVFTVNSGVGIEAILHEKPIYMFGESEYSPVVNRIQPIDCLNSSIQNESSLVITDYMKFITWFFKREAIDVNCADKYDFFTKIKKQISSICNL